MSTSPSPARRAAVASTLVPRPLRRSDPMPTDFLMPKLGLTMEEGTITAWLVPDGAEVTAGMPVMAIETDKVETEVEASANGYLHQRGAVGDTFPCGAVVGQIDVDGSGVAPAASAPAATSPSPVAASPV